MYAVMHGSRARSMARRWTLSGNQGRGWAVEADRARGGGVNGNDDSQGWVELSEAIEALRTALVAAWWDGQHQRVRFRVAPVDLTVQVGVTRVGKGVAGIRWHVLS